MHELPIGLGKSAAKKNLGRPFLGRFCQKNQIRGQIGIGIIQKKEWLGMMQVSKYGTETNLPGREKKRLRKCDLLKTTLA